MDINSEEFAIKMSDDTLDVVSNLLKTAKVNPFFADCLFKTMVCNYLDLVGPPEDRISRLEDLFKHTKEYMTMDMEKFNSEILRKYNLKEMEGS